MIVWGPFTFTETDLTPSGGAALVKSIAIDFSTIPTGTNALALVFSAGDVAFHPGNFGDLSFLVGGTATGLDGTLIWDGFGTGSGNYPQWTTILSILGVAGCPLISPFTNPNPSGTSWLKFFASAGGDAPSPQAGIRNYTISIVSPPPRSPAPGATGKFNYVIIPASEKVRQGGLNREATVSSVPSGTSFTFKATDYNYMTPYTEALAGVTVTKKKALAAPAGIPGPFTYDMKMGLPVTEIDATLAQIIEQGKKYSSILLDTGINPNPALAFPDSEGFLVFNFGRTNAVGPVKYLGRLGSAELAVDASFRFPVSFSTGITVTLLDGRTPFQPPQGTNPGNFYVTGSAAGRVAAESTLDDTVAAGVPINVDIVYPGDIGLGGEGLPTRGADKLSDAVSVWGGDQLDAEVAKAHQG